MMPIEHILTQSLHVVALTRPAQLAELPCSEFDPELFPHSAVKFFVTFLTIVPY